jgi:tetratricopeptide (TPR) repeat protein
MSLSANEVADAAARSHDRPRPYLAVALGIVALTLIAYAPIYWNGYIFLDDGDYITNNPPIAKGLTAETMRWAWTTNHHGFYHPLTWLSLLADVSIFGYHPWAFHLTNLVLHILTSVGLFLVFVRMTDAFWPSAVLAALFAVHPMHVESVAWAAERKDVLSTFFLVLTIASYVRTAHRPSIGAHVLTSVFFTLGLLAKPMLVTLPFGLLLFDVWPLRRTNLTGAETPSRFGRRSWIELVAEKLPLFALAFAFSLLTFRLQKDVGAVVPLSRLPWQPRIATVLEGYVWYLTTTLVPMPLAAFHTHRLEIPPIEMIFPALLLVGITIGFLLLFRTHPELLVGWLWFGGTLFPVSGIVQSGPQAYADRFAYVPHIGLFIVLVWGGMILARRLHFGSAALGGIVAAVLLVCTGLSCRQVSLWRDTETLYLHTLAVTTGNHWGHAILGEYYLTQGRLDDAAKQLEISLSMDDRTRQVIDDLGQVEILRGHFADAEKAVRASLRIDPKDIETQHRLAYVLFFEQKTDEAADILEKVLAKHPQRALSQELLGEVRNSQRRYDDAITHLTAALDLWPDYTKAHGELAGVYLERNEFSLAEKQFAEAIRLRRDDPMTWSGLFRAVYRQDRAQDAVRIANEAMAQFPGVAVFRGMRALALDRLGRRNEARNDYDELERIAPGWAEGAARTAMRMATSVDDVGRNEALELAEQAAASTEFRKVWALEPLAASQAALGRFDAAIATIDRAVALPMLPAMLVARLREDRAKFMRREPLREPAIERERPGE